MTYVALVLRRAVTIATVAAFVGDVRVTWYVETAAYDDVGMTWLPCPLLALQRYRSCRKSSRDLGKVDIALASVEKRF
jgi:hypothetical protein